MTRTQNGHPAVAWTLFAATLAMFAAFGVVLYTPLTPPPVLQYAGAISGFWVLPYASVPLVGLLIVLRRPGNAVGWLALAVSALLSFGALTALLGSVLNYEHSAAAPWVLLGSSLWNGSASAAEGGLFILLLVFPDGHLKSPRWRWAVFAVVAVTAIALILELINPASGLGIDSQGKSLLAVDGAGPVVTALGVPLTVAFVACGVAAVLSVFLRLRGASSERRHQIKWVAAAGALTISLITALNLVPAADGASPPPLALATIAPLLLIAGVAVPVAIGVAVLKYRLYDIDVIINRAIVYGALAVFITAMYIGIAVGIGTLVGSGGQPNLGLSVVATIIVAVGFQPLRERLQRLANRLVYGKRATPYEVLSEFSAQVAETYAAGDVLPRMARVLQQGTGAEAATVWLREGSQLRPAAAFPDAIASQEPMHMSNGSLPAFPAATRAVEVRHQGELLGSLTVIKRHGESLTPIEQKLVDDLAQQAGLVLKNVGLTTELLHRIEELRASRQRLVTAQDEERRRLERNLHDGAQQNLVALKVKLGLVEMLAVKDPAKAAAVLDQLKVDADEALETLRDLARGIYPPLLAEKGLVTALESQARKAALPVCVDADGIGRYQQEVEATVYFCVLEALQNVQKYAAATEVHIRVCTVDGSSLLFEVTDDGRGFDVASVTRGAGLTNMQDRLDALGGRLDVTSEPAHGATIAGSVPVGVGATALPEKT